MLASTRAGNATTAPIRNSATWTHCAARRFIGAGYDLKNIRGVGRTVCTNTAGVPSFRATVRRRPYARCVYLVANWRETGFDRSIPIQEQLPSGAQPLPAGSGSLRFEEMFNIMRPKYQEAKAKANLESTDTGKTRRRRLLGSRLRLDGPSPPMHGLSFCQRRCDGRQRWKTLARAPYGYGGFDSRRSRPQPKPSQIKSACTTRLRRTRSIRRLRQNTVTGTSIVAAC